ncbi:MAG: hypothetical protein Q7R35_05505 [Elusimicrobiota bacterium]|nr:hypothetical protein [Elusimicrobiota bacterium]
MSISAETISTRALTMEDKLAMFGLLDAHFDGVSLPAFLHDLAEKTWVIVLRDRATGNLAGFSTLMLLETSVDGVAVTAVFSGDTIIARQYWGDPVIVKAWFKFILGFSESRPGERLYWFLISQGHRTYRLLPLYLNEFYPRRGTPTPPAEKRVLDTLALAKFPGEYDPATGVIRHAGAGQRLKRDLSEISTGRLKNQDIAFFAEMNPGHREGDELACIARLERGNYRKIAYRILNWGDGPGL